VIFPWTLIFLSWALLVTAFLTQRNVLIDHDYLLRTSHLPWIVALFVFLLSWQTMTMAMMLPSSLSRMLILYESPGSGVRTQAVFIVAYALVWTGFALLAFLGDTLFHQGIQHWWWLSLHSQVIGTLTLAVAGVYQWSSLKRRCLERCIALTSARTSMSLQETFLSDWKQGLDYGKWCLGSSWALMLVMFGIGMRSLFVMALFSLVMFLECEVFKGKRFRFAIGGALLLLALLWYLFPLSG
jgi:predicted metal-binding membrane protein